MNQKNEPIGGQEKDLLARGRRMSQSYPILTDLNFVLVREPLVRLY